MQAHVFTCRCMFAHQACLQVHSLLSKRWQKLNTQHARASAYACVHIHSCMSKCLLMYAPPAINPVFHKPDNRSTHITNHSPILPPTRLHSDTHRCTSTPCQGRRSMDRHEASICKICIHCKKQKKSPTCKTKRKFSLMDPFPRIAKMTFESTRARNFCFWDTVEFIIVMGEVGRNYQVQTYVKFCTWLSDVNANMQTVLRIVGNWSFSITVYV